MFENIGEKIKSLAKICTYIGIAIFMMLEIVAIALIKNIFIGLIITGVGFFISWISSFLLYGFGEIISQSQIIANNTIKQNINQNEKNKNTNHEKFKDAKIEAKRHSELNLSKFDSIHYEDITCKICGEMLSVTERDKNDPNFICHFCNNKLN